jgi:hypothetical protein
MAQWRRAQIFLKKDWIDGRSLGDDVSWAHAGSTAETPK